MSENKIVPLNRAQMLLGGIGATERRKRAEEAAAKATASQPSMADVFDAVARKHGKTTIMQSHPGERYMLWVTADERDPMTALMLSALSIIVKRKLNYNGFEFEMTLLTVIVGTNFTHEWAIREKGVKVVSGYASSEHDALMQMLSYLWSVVL